jgi:hypothetical protein
MADFEIYNGQSLVLSSPHLQNNRDKTPNLAPIRWLGILAKTLL